MLIISHRANLAGPNAYLENHPDAVDNTINCGFAVELDVWFEQTKMCAPRYYMLGHDKPQYEVTKYWLRERRKHLWLHCKNLEALMYLRDEGLHVFWHQTDSYTLTSRKYIWAFPGFDEPHHKLIKVLPELDKNDHIVTTDQFMEVIGECFHSSIYGICTDYPLLAANNLRYTIDNLKRIERK